MLSGEGNENGGKTTIGLLAKKQQRSTLFLHFFAVVLHDYNVKLPETSRNFLVTRFMKKMSYLFLHFFFTAAHFHRCGL